jgi:hypothetical protein
MMTLSHATNFGCLNQNPKTSYSGSYSLAR